jgi:hypothetical protein
MFVVQEEHAKRDLSDQIVLLGRQHWLLGLSNLLAPFWREQIPHLGDNILDTYMVLSAITKKLIRYFF